jgi:predicted DNA binding CopG/RHH family protein
MPETRIFPDFKSEAEEAEWWDSHQDESMEAFEKAAAEGRLGRGTVARKAGLPTTTIRLDPADIELARVQAEKKGLKYQTYLKMLIHEALTRESESREILTQEAKAS